MRVAFLTSDGRSGVSPSSHFNSHKPHFGTAPRALLDGFASLSKESTSHLLKDPLEIHIISCTQQAVQSPEKLASNIWFHSLHVPKWGWLRSGYLGCILAAKKKLREIKPDLVHAQGTERDCAISAAFTSYPKLLTIHGNLRLIKKAVGFPPFSIMWLQTLIEGFVIPSFDGIICISNYTKQAVERETPRTWVVPNAVDPTFFEIVRRPIISPVILVVADVTPRKNQNAFIKALDSLSSELRFKVRFFGRCADDDYGREFQALIAARSWCEYGGMIGRGALREQFATASLLALPTHEDNCPMVALEAMAAGLPVIASKVGGIPDLIDGVTTGLFIDSRDPQSMQQVLRSLLDDQAGLGKRLGDAGKKMALSRFHPDVVAAQHFKIYRETVLRHRKNTPDSSEGA